MSASADPSSRAAPTAATVNIADRLADAARLHPDKPAVIHERGGGRTDAIRFDALEATAGGYARGLQRAGLRRGQRVIVMIRPGVDFFAVTFALFKLGAVPVLVDPGIGRSKLVNCLASVEAEAFIGIPLAHVLRLIYRRRFRSLQLLITAGRRWGWGGHVLSKLCEQPGIPFPATATRAEETAAILFTSGSTGPPKGVVYAQATFDAQVRALRDVFGYGPDEVDLATFPLFALFDAALGMTAVIPDMDATRPGFVDPEKILTAVSTHGCTHMFGSPALLNRVGRYCVESGRRLETIRRVITAGAPVAAENLSRFRAALPGDARIFTPYGATEALPIASIESREILEETAARTAVGQGVCVGRPLPGIRVRIIEIDDGPIASLDDARDVATGEIGEICVAGPVVTRGYFRSEAHTRLARMQAADGTAWHRMGDVGRMDEHGRIWMCGRKSQRVESADGVRFTICVEQIFNQHPKVFRTALVGVGERGRQRPVICVELEPGGQDPAAVLGELREMARRHDLTRGIDTFLVHPAFPVDVRHNAKIFREKLAVWAAAKIATSRS